MQSGKIQPEVVQRLKEIGEWMALNGETIYGTRGGPTPPQNWGVTTNKDDKVYVHIFNVPEDGKVTLPNTGNLKVKIAATAETGLHPDIIAGRQGAFVVSADPVNATESELVQYEIEAGAITYIADATFNGVITYAKDNVWHKLDMGAPVPNNVVYNTDNVVYDTDNVIYGA